MLEIGLSFVIGFACGVYAAWRYFWNQIGRGLGV